MNTITQIKSIFKTLFRLGADKTDETTVIEGIKSAINFQGAKLWVLILAIFVASLGLNTNSTAVIIGAMLISPIMGPIIGMGLSVGICDFPLLRRSFRNFAVATIFSILTATVYFLLTPMDQAQSELLARTSPTIYDVLIALSGGLAGIIALGSASQRNGNVIPGVAIATALMPPLCTVGFGIATANWLYALGAFYLFLINTVFIALATFFGARYIMNFHKVAFLNIAQQRKVTRLLSAIAIAVIIPSVFITVHIVRETIYQRNAHSYISGVLNFPDTHVINQSISFKDKTIEVVLIGSDVDTTAISNARKELAHYHLEGTTLSVIQNNYDLSPSNAGKRVHQEHDLAVIAEQNAKIKQLQSSLSAYTDHENLAEAIYPEIQTLFPEVNAIAMVRGREAGGTDSIVSANTSVIIITLSRALSPDNKSRLQDWLTKRTATDSLRILYSTTAK